MTTNALPDKWCWIHQSDRFTFDGGATDDKCSWSKAAGFRPGQAPCRFTDAKVTYEVGEGVQE